MKEILSKILEELQRQTKELKYQTGLMEFIYHQKDENEHDRDEMVKRTKDMKEMIRGMVNPNDSQTSLFVENILRIMPGGD